MASGINWLPFDQFAFLQGGRLPQYSTPLSDAGEVRNPLYDYSQASGVPISAITAPGGSVYNDPAYQTWMREQVLSGRSPEQFIRALNSQVGLGPVTQGISGAGGYWYDPTTGQVGTQSFDDDMGDLAGLALLAAPLAAMVAPAIAGAGAGAAGAGGAGGGALTAGELAGYDMALGGLGGTAGAEGLAGSGLGAGAGLGAGGTDWWSQYGLTPADVGLEANPWTTNPSLADLGGTIGSSGGFSLPNLPPGVSQLLQVLGGGGGGAGQGGFLGQGMTQSGGGGFNLGQLLPFLGAGSGLKTMLGSKPAVDPAMIAALWQAGQNTYNTALDPRAALYARTQQQIQDQTRAGQAARGIAMSPYGARLEDESMRNFNIDWQNQQLQRQLEGLRGFAGAGDTAARAGVAGAAQTFAQNQTGLNNLTTALGQLTGQGGLFGPSQPGAQNQNPNLGWLGAFNPSNWGTSDTSSPVFDPSTSYNSQGTFQPYYTGYDYAGGPAYG